MSGGIPLQSRFRSELVHHQAIQQECQRLHPNGRLCGPGCEFMLCAANIKILLLNCLEPRAPPPLARRMRLCGSSRRSSKVSWKSRHSADKSQHRGGKKKDVLIADGGGNHCSYETVEADSGEAVKAWKGGRV